MTRKDFELIAAAMRDARPISRDMSNRGVNAAHSTLDSLAQNFAERLALTNARFNRERFLTACGVQS